MNVMSWTKRKFQKVNLRAQKTTRRHCYFPWHFIIISPIKTIAIFASFCSTAAENRGCTIASAKQHNAPHTIALKVRDKSL